MKSDLLSAMGKTFVLLDMQFNKIAQLTSSLCIDDLYSKKEKAMQYVIEQFTEMSIGYGEDVYGLDPFTDEELSLLSQTVVESACEQFCINGKGM
jgi:hypothetical protein